MNRHVFRFAWLALAAIVPSMTACKDDTIVGTYTATTFTITPEGGATQDVLAAGGDIDLTINHDFSTSGNLSIPAGVEGGPFSVSLLGDAAQQGDEVTLTLVADSFLRDITFTFDGNSLSGTGTFSGVTVVTLSK